MPWKVEQTSKGYQLRKLTDNSLNPKVFKTRQSAINMGKRWMQYRKEIPVVRGNRVLAGR